MALVGHHFVAAYQIKRYLVPTARHVRLRW